KNLPLIKYSIHQIIKTKQPSINYLTTFIPHPKHQHSQLYTPPKPLQLIKHTQHNPKPFIQFPTQLLNSQHHSLIPLLPQSPPPSTSLSLPLQVLHKNFPHYQKHSTPKLQKIIPSYA
ncbi:malate:quinone oxidoreductase, partial [Staphylococcus epidermidis]|uniref:malate:quinone oxidoreductase n=1 Tax=Staphylococcus epidermidis TaxID=1282 RepID=UPI0016426333